MESPLIPKYSPAPPHVLSVRYMLLSEMLHGPNLDPAAAVIWPVSVALYASSVPAGKWSFFSDK